MAEYEDVFAIAKQLENEKKKEDDPTEDELQENKANEESKVNWSFLREVPEYMKCKVCCEIFVEPQLLSCCGKSICKQCIENHIQRTSLRDQKPSCPFCRKEEFQRIKINALETSINLLQIQCPYRSNGCGWNGAMKDGKLHLKECDFFLIDCPNRCGCETFSRSKLSDHLSKCTHQYTSCPFRELGCEAEMLRKEMNGHAIADVHQHLLQIAQSNIQASSDCKSALASFDTTYDRSFKQGIVVDAIASHKMELASLKSTIKKLEDEIEEEQQSIDSLSRSVDEFERIIAQFRGLQDQAKTEKDIYTATITEIQTMPVPNAVGISYPPIIFTIDNFKKRKATNECWLSPPFYTHIGGYKMCLTVHPNGHRCVRGRFVSVCIHFMTGEFDDHLRWPFPGGIFTITAIRQRGNKSNKSMHVVVNEVYNKAMRNKHINGIYGTEAGESEFLNIANDLQNFLVDDSFMIMVYRIQFLPL